MQTYLPGSLRPPFPQVHRGLVNTYLTASNRSSVIMTNISTGGDESNVIIQACGRSKREKGIVQDDLKFWRTIERGYPNNYRTLLRYFHARQ